MRDSKISGDWSVLTGHKTGGGSYYRFTNETYQIMFEVRQHTIRMLNREENMEERQLGDGIIYPTLVMSIILEDPDFFWELLGDR